MTNRVILVTGATGHQGGATIRALAGKGFALRALTRKPDGAAARTLASLGAEIVKGDLDDVASLKRALDGAWGAYAVQSPWEGGIDKEEAQGKRFAQLAREAGVRHYVYASVGSAHRRTGIPHFESKWRIEQTVRDLGFPSHVIIRPVFFMENLLSPTVLDGDRLSLALAPSTVVQMVAVKDIGAYGALAFTDALRLNRREIDIAGDAVTIPRAAETLSSALGRTITHVAVPIAELRTRSEDAAIMFEWFEQVGYDADIAGNAREFGIEPTSLAEWASSLTERV